MTLPPTWYKTESQDPEYKQNESAHQGRTETQTCAPSVLNNKACVPVIDGISDVDISQDLRTLTRHRATLTQRPYKARETVDRRAKRAAAVNFEPTEQMLVRSKWANLISAVITSSAPSQRTNTIHYGVSLRCPATAHTLIHCTCRL